MADLQHYGVLGMRWGKRKGGQSVKVGPGIRGAVKELGGLYKDAVKDDIDRFKSFASRLRKTVEPSPDFARSRQLKKKPIAKLSNEELKTIITRLQLEKQLKDLDAGSRNKGKGILSKMLLNLAATGVNAYAQTQVDPRFVSMFTQMKEEVRQKRG
jgi:hypothetical protein